MHQDLPVTPLPVLAPDAAGAYRTVELEINTACDLACFGCDRFSDVTSAPNMAPAQVRLFVRESLDLGWVWERIRLLGGEPTLHPQFMDCVRALLPYRERFPDCFLQVLTNGQGKAALYREPLAELGVDLHAEYKERDVQPGWFLNTRIAPVDRDPATGALPPCTIHGPRGCGIGLTRHGYFLDGAGAAVARVAGLDVGVQSLAGVTQAAMLAQAVVLCRLCGHWNPKDGPGVVRRVSETGAVTGRFWTAALERYRVAPARLTVYGGNA